MQYKKEGNLGNLGGWEWEWEEEGRVGRLAGMRVSRRRAGS